MAARPHCGPGVGGGGAGLALWRDEHLRWAAERRRGWRRSASDLLLTSAGLDDDDDAGYYSSRRWRRDQDLQRASHDANSVLASVRAAAAREAWRRSAAADNRLWSDWKPRPNITANSLLGSNYSGILDDDRLQQRRFLLARSEVPRLKVTPCDDDPLEKYHYSRGDYSPLGRRRAGTAESVQASNRLRVPEADWQRDASWERGYQHVVRRLRELPPPPPSSRLPLLRRDEWRHSGGYSSLPRHLPRRSVVPDEDPLSRLPKRQYAPLSSPSRVHQDDMRSPRARSSYLPPSTSADRVQRSATWRYRSHDALPYVSPTRTTVRGEKYERLGNYSPRISPPMRDRMDHLSPTADLETGARSRRRSGRDDRPPIPPRPLKMGGWDAGYGNQTPSSMAPVRGRNGREPPVPPRPPQLRRSERVVEGYSGQARGWEENRSTVPNTSPGSRTPREERYRQQRPKLRRWERADEDEPPEDAARRRREEWRRSRQQPAPGAEWRRSGSDDAALARRPRQPDAAPDASCRRSGSDHQLRANHVTPARGPLPRNANGDFDGAKAAAKAAASVGNHVTVMPSDPADGSTAALTATPTTTTGCKVPLRSSTVSVVTKPDRPQHLSQVLAALAVSLGPFAAGLGKGYSSPAIASLEQQGALFPVSAQQASWVASLSLLGALCGGLLGGLAMRFGRRRLLLATALPLSACWVATVFATSVEMMFATAFFGGFCYAIVLVVTQVYISEISVPDIRGCLSALQKTVGHAGTLTSFAVGAYLDWRQLAAVVAAAPLLLFAAALCVPETPSFLVVAGRDAEALAALRWLRGPGADVRRELATLRGNVLARGGDPAAQGGRAGGRLSALRRCPPPPGLLRPTLTTCGLMLFQRFSGAHAFSFYAVPILRQTLGGMDPHGGAVAVALVQLLASLLSGLLIDTAGRLPLLLASSTLMSMALAGFGSFAYYEDLHPQAAPHLDWIPLLCVLVFTVAFSLGISPISWLLIGELFPLEHRELGSAIATAFSYVCAFVGVKTFVDFQQALGLHGAFWLYAAVSLAGLCFVVCCVPETKGRDLDEMHPKGASA